MRLRNFKYRWWYLLIGLAAVLLLLIGPVDWACRYWSWRNLSKTELIEAADWYIEHRVPGNKACLYAVVCENNRPSLELVKSVDEWDIRAAKQLAWKRRFQSTCAGRTANFGLELLSDELVGIGEAQYRRRAVWSFYNDRFVPLSGRMHGPHAFSEIEPEPCRAEYVVTTLNE